MKKTTFFIKLVNLVLIMGIICLASACSVKLPSSPDGNSNTSNKDVSVYEDTDFIMGTAINLTIYTSGKNISSEIIDSLSTTENKQLSWKVEDSEIAKINEEAGSNNGTEVSDKTLKYITDALSIAQKSDGAFDPTVGQLTRLWGFDDNPNSVPDKEKIHELVKNVSYKNVTITENTIKLQKDTKLDLGGIGKGIATDEIEKYIKDNKDIRGMLTNIGGSSILVYGKKNTDEPWKVAVVNPEDKEDYLGYIELNGTHHISTTGNYEKYFEENGKRYHHILDPKTGYPAESGLLSVTVVSKTGAVSDGLSTACFVMGKEKAMDLLHKYDSNAIFVDEDKNVYVTDGLKDKFELIDQVNYKQI